MGHKQLDIRHGQEINKSFSINKGTQNYDIVLEKSIFNNIFGKDIRRIFLYKKAERLAKAIHLIAPAFAESVSLRHRIDTIAIALIDAAIVPSGGVRETLSRELLTLSSILSVAQTGGYLSSMNVELITHETHMLLKEVSVYEEPRLSLDEAPTLSDIAKQSFKKDAPKEYRPIVAKRGVPTSARRETTTKGHIKDKRNIQDRRDAVLYVIKNKKQASIKDISTLVRNVSEKTIQRELLSLIGMGVVVKEGERRWSTYSLA